MASPSLPQSQTQKMTAVFVASADPDLAWGPQRLRQTIALQSLLFARPVIQDNFLLCGQALQLCSEKDQIVEKLLRKDVLSVALRDTAHGLYDLSKKQALKAQDGTFRPFVGDTSELYASKDFEAHAVKLDRALSAGASALPWTPTVLGSDYRDLLAASASGSELGGKSYLALQAFDAVEKKTSQSKAASSHSCSDYYDIADEMFSGDDRTTVKAWARWYYLLNLPTKLKIKSWLPSHVLSKHPRRTVLSNIPWKKSEEDVHLSEGLFNEEFLASIPPEGILELRGEPAFTRMQNAMKENDVNAFLLEFDAFKMTVHSRVGEFLPESYKRGNQLKARALSLSRAGTASNLLGTAIGGAIGAFAGALGIAIGGGIGSALGYGIKFASDTFSKRILDERQQIFDSAHDRLRNTRFRGDALSLLDLVHGPIQSESN